jgi:hypothetical protein
MVADAPSELSLTPPQENYWVYTSLAAVPVEFIAQLKLFPVYLKILENFLFTATENEKY